eukprot:TRINITY_DN3074_c0_g1_i2.p1 TRINITY_DN3074_c0_g1~~TRINITY_DN3074_c0_g1_i2.p1  ORF type:complete len:687 (+),score=177.89 TRINITY_DN3074_c0_g1_i2:164-2224(+)
MISIRKSSGLEALDPRTDDIINNRIVPSAAISPGTIGSSKISSSPQPGSTPNHDHIGEIWGFASVFNNPPANAIRAFDLGDDDSIDFDLDLNDGRGIHPTRSEDFEQVFDMDQDFQHGDTPTSISPTPSQDSFSFDGSQGVPPPFGEHPQGEHPSRTLFVRNINSSVDDTELSALFDAYGPIRSMYTQCKHRGFVMISYYDIRHAKNAMRHLQSKVIRRRKLDIHYSIPKDNPSEKDQNQGTLVVFNLDPSTTNDELKAIFGANGEIKEIRETPNKKHHKFIEFFDVRDAEKAMKNLNKTEIRGKKIKIEPSRPGGRKNSLTPLPSEFSFDDEEVLSPPGNLGNLGSLGASQGSHTSLGYTNSGNSLTSGNSGMNSPVGNSPYYSFHVEHPRQQSPEDSSSYRHAVMSPPNSGFGNPKPFKPTVQLGNGNGLGVGFGNFGNSAPNSTGNSGVSEISHPPLAHSPLARVGSRNSSFSFGSSLGEREAPVFSPSPSPPAWGIPRDHVSSGPQIVGFNPGTSLGSSGPLMGTSLGTSLGTSVGSNPLSASTPNYLGISPPSEGVTRTKRSDSTEDNSRYRLNLSRVGSEDLRTTLMIRNIPNKYTQKMLLAAVDERHRGTYDFFYLPIDFKNKCNVGYAFINFIRYDCIVSFHEEFNVNFNLKLNLKFNLKFNLNRERSGRNSTRRRCA